MEPSFLLPMGEALDQEDTDPLSLPDAQMEDINIKTQRAVESVKHAIQNFKRDFYTGYVGNDKGHGPQDLGAMMGFHALFLQTVGYWIGLLDSKPVPAPTFQSGKERRAFAMITKAIQELASNPDGRTLIYSLLFHFAQQHPFDLGQQENVEDE
jgi:hypothetical protein